MSEFVQWSSDFGKVRNKSVTKLSHSKKIFDGLGIGRFRHINNCASALWINANSTMIYDVVVTLNTENITSL